MLLHKELPTFNAVKAGERATCDLVLGPRYHIFNLEVSDAVGSDVEDILDEIVVKINGKPQRTCTAAKLDALNRVNGQEYGKVTVGTQGVAGYKTYLPIYLAEPWRKGMRVVSNTLQPEASLSAWNAVGIASLQIECKVKAGVNTPVIVGDYEYDDATGPIGEIVKWIDYSFGALGSRQDFSTLDKKDLLQALHLFPTVETTPKFVEKLRLTINNVPVIDLIDTHKNQAKLIRRGLEPDTAAVPRYDAVIDYDDPISSGALLRGNNDDPRTAVAEMTLHVEYNAAAAGTLQVTVIRAGRPE